MQISPNKLQSGGGSGLGLWVAKSIVEMHGGKISVYSEGEPGKGTSFHVDIPISKLDAPPASFMDQSTYAQHKPLFLSRNTKSALTSTRGKLPIEPKRRKSVTIHPDVDMLNLARVRESYVGELITSARSSKAPSLSSSLASSPATGSSYLSKSRLRMLSLKARLTPPIKPDDTITGHNYESKYTLQSVLVVDDSQLNRKMVVRHLKLKAAHIEEAVDGLDALEKVRYRTCILL